MPTQRQNLYRAPTNPPPIPLFYQPPVQHPLQQSVQVRNYWQCGRHPAIHIPIGQPCESLECQQISLNMQQREQDRMHRAQLAAPAAGGAYSAASGPRASLTPPPPTAGTPSGGSRPPRAPKPRPAHLDKFTHVEQDKWRCNTCGGQTIKYNKTKKHYDDDEKRALEARVRAQLQANIKK